MAARAPANSDLKFLLDREGVDIAFQTQLFAAGVSSVAQFGALVKDPDELRTMLQEDFTIPGEGLAKHVAVSRIVVAWARARATRAAEADAKPTRRTRSSRRRRSSSPPTLRP